MKQPHLQPRTTPGARAEVRPDGTWRLSIPAGPAGRYRLAQLDDYRGRPRRVFPWWPPFCLEVRARVSAAGLPGTWGFGLWNDPFAVSLGLRGTERRLPTLPNAAWFFHASPPNYLALRDDHPAHGLLAATFASPPFPPALFALGLPLLPLLAWHPTAGLLRRAARRWVREDARRLAADPTRWHIYRLEWLDRRVRFLLDGALAFETSVAPRGPLGLVLWIDNQYAAFAPGDRVRFGTLPHDQPAWLDLEVQV